MSINRNSYITIIKIVTGFLRNIRRILPSEIVEICCAFWSYKYDIEPNNRTGYEILRDNQVHKIYFRVNKECDKNDIHL